MKATEWKRALRPILPADQACGFRETLCYRLPMEWVATGALGEGSAYTKDVYVWRVVAPLFVPRKTLGPSYSQRVGRGQTYGLDDLDAPEPAGLSARSARSPIGTLPRQPDHKVDHLRIQATRGARRPVCV